MKPLPEIIAFRPTKEQRKRLQAEREQNETPTALMRRILEMFFAEDNAQ